MTAKAALCPPTWMKRAEKREFRRVIAARSGLGTPVSEAELDTVVDYVLARLRLVELRDRAAKAEFPNSYLKIVRAIEATTATSRRLAQDLRLIAPPAPPLGKKAAAALAAEKAAGGGWDDLLHPGGTGRFRTARPPAPS